ncbi:MAG: NADH-quinone oxidoreductase subunit L [Paracoccaceae bacterium]|nr:MAG: NADH-quinone oxidoreductase subunit L [Paracoccaceae bacterium]
MLQVILFAPIVGAILCGFGWRAVGETAAQAIATGLVFLAAFLSWIVFFTFDGESQQIVLLRWIESGTLSTDWSIRLDRLTAIMLVVVNTVSALVHLYSFGYMAHDDNWKEGEAYKARFFAYLSFFTFTMLMLVTGDNLVQIFFGWEGVGVASYLLIGFYYRKGSANAAAMKAFIVNRVGDFGFALGIFALFLLVDSVRFDDIFAAAPQLAETEIRFLWTGWNAAELISVLIFIGAMGKSAQLILHTWLPDAMEGPTPVSALIHAATMVTAGVFLVCRMSPLLEYAPSALAFITALGAFTAFFAATVGLVQNDIKRVIAYSTCSQLGYMFVAAGVGAYPVAMFHLFTHAFFKAMLFLGAGSVIHATHHEQDMRNYGGLRKHIPMTFWAMMVGTLAITGVGIPFSYDLVGLPIGFAGFLSKDAVIESAYVGSQGAFWLLVAAAAMTSFYSWRLMFMTFYGEPRWASAHSHGHHAQGHGNHDHAHDDHGHHEPHESPRVMLVPLAVLGLGAIFSGMLWYSVFFGKEDAMRAWFGLEPAHHQSAEGHGDDHASGTADPAAAPADSHAAADTAAHGAADAAHAAAVAPKGAVFFHPENTVIHDAHYVPTWVKLSPFFAMLFGLALAWLFYIRRPDLPGRLAASQRPLYLFLLNKWYFDELYDWTIVRPAMWLAQFFWKKGDGNVIDGAINGLALGIIPRITRAAGRAQSGYIFTYAFAMVVGIAILITLMTLGGGAN